MAIALLLASGGVGAIARTPLQSLYPFRNLKGTAPASGLIEDGAGNLYGTTVSGGRFDDGVVFELSPPPPGHGEWTETVIHSFNGSDGKNPEFGRLLFDAAGNLYGTTTTGGKSGRGVVYELSPPPPGQRRWTERVIHEFNGRDGQNPGWGLVADGAGNLYGATGNGGDFGRGVVFELSPPPLGQRAWTDTVIDAFSSADLGFSPSGELLADGAGNLYGTTVNGGDNNEGVAYELSPPAAGTTAWTETVLVSFDGANGNGPQGGLIADGAGNLYGTTFLNDGRGALGCVFELSPPTAGQTGWSETVLYEFPEREFHLRPGFPNSGLTADAAGNLYGTTAAYGTRSGNNSGSVYELSPPAQGGGAWTRTLLVSFDSTDGRNPSGGRLFRDVAGNLYGTAASGGKLDEGIAFKLTP